MVSEIYSDNFFNDETRITILNHLRGDPSFSSSINYGPYLKILSLIPLIIKMSKKH
jgi:hypothetical protein